MVVSLMAEQPDRPNILWIVSEDNSPLLGAYGDPVATTPNLDALAADGLVYERAYANAPVCAPARFTLLTGTHANAMGTLNMRSYFPKPDWVKPAPLFLREAGYYTSNNFKTDYNFDGQHITDFWDACGREAHYRDRAEGQPFYHMVTLMDSHESRLHKETSEPRHDPEKVVLPPEHPDLPDLRRDWARYYDILERMDARVGRILAELEAEGLQEDTIVFYFADHGGAVAGSKRFLNERGLRVPLILHVPERWQHLFPEGSAGRSDRLVGFIDFVPTLLSLAGIEPPAYMPGRPFAGPYQTEAADALLSYRGRMDERFDYSRSWRDERFRYTRHYLPDLPLGRWLSYLWRADGVHAWEAANEAGDLPTNQRAFWGPKPIETLHDIEADPWQVQNLVGDPAYAEVLEGFRQRNREHLRTVADLGLMPEGELAERIGEQTPYAWVRDKDFPYDRVVEVAERASQGGPADLEFLVERLDDPEPVVRFWAATGLRQLGSAALPARAALLCALEASDGDAQIAVAEVLVGLGEGEKAAPILFEGLRDPEPITALRAVNAVERLGGLLEPWFDTLDALTPTDAEWHNFASDLYKHWQRTRER